MHKISVIGVGYVGAVSAACLAKDGHIVVAADVMDVRVDAINQGLSPILEPGLDEMIAEGVAAKRLSATNNIGKAVLDTDISFVCVGTPSRPNGSLNIDYCIKAAETIGAAIKSKKTWHSVVFRSTILPGTMDDFIIPALERSSGLIAGKDFGVGYYPEFLRESTAIKDHYNADVIVFGKIDDKTVETLTDIVSVLPGTPTVVPIKTAEAVKYTNNCWHALKISFANEIGNLCKSAGIDSHTVMEILCSDTRLNISKAYMMPGFAFGGSCLPKDLRALRYFGRSKDTPTPILDATLDANEVQISRAFNAVMESGARSVGLHGLTFKSDTDDLRESPYVELAERMTGKGLDVTIFDSNLNNRNEDMILDRLPHLKERLVDDVHHLIENSDVIVIAKRDEESREIIRRANGSKKIIDLVRVDKQLTSSKNYDGLCW